MEFDEEIAREIEDGEPGDDGHQNLYTCPRDKNHLRACFVCGLIKVSVCAQMGAGSTSYNRNHVSQVPNRAHGSLNYIQTETQFFQEGCENCEMYLELKGNRGAVEEYTTPNFIGFGLSFAQDTIHVLMNIFPECLLRLCHGTVGPPSGSTQVSLVLKRW